MAHTVQFLPLARLELIEARNWYGQRSSGLGEVLVQEVDHQVQRIAENPTGFPLMLADVRRARLCQFPYSLFYRIVSGESLSSLAFTRSAIRRAGRSAPNAQYKANPSCG